MNNLAPIYLQEEKREESPLQPQSQPQAQLQGRSKELKEPSLTLTLPLIGPIEISSSVDSVVQGRGLIATKNIEPGECLFVTRPAVSVPVEEVRRVWLNKCRSAIASASASASASQRSASASQESAISGGSEMNIELELELTKKLEQIAETILVKKTKRILKSCRGSRIGNGSAGRNGGAGKCAGVGAGNNTNKDGGGRASTVALAMSILSQVADEHHNHNLEQYQTNDINIVAGSKVRTGEEDKDEDEDHVNVVVAEDISNEAILSIIHQNAFGPDFRHYHSMAMTWLSNANSDADVNANANPSEERRLRHNPYGRILGLYPLAAMINHSCQPNAVRVYSCSTCNNNTSSSSSTSNRSSDLNLEYNSEVMAVHATQPIKKGEEIVWSYVPTTRPYHDRQQRLKGTFGFNCDCPRCVVEKAFFTNESLNIQMTMTMAMAPFEIWNIKATNISELPPPSKFHDLMVNLEALLNDKQIVSSGELCRYIRVGMVTFYTNYFNVMLSSVAQNDHNNNSTHNRDRTCSDGSGSGSKEKTKAMIKKEVLGLAAKVHLSLAAVDHGTTEHLSILHLCYELANELCRDNSNGNGNGNNNSGKTNANSNLSKFYSTQLQKAHLCRYGQLGGKVELLREIMIHSRGVLRRIQGFEHAKYCFI